MKNTPFHNREVADLLASFTKADCKAFARFLEYQGNRPLVALWKALQKKHPEYNIRDEKLYQQVWPKQSFHDNTFRALISGLYRLAREFVAYQEFRSNDFLHGNTMTMGLLKRGAKQAFLKAERENDKRYEKTKEYNTNYYAYRYQKEDIRYQYVTIFEHRAHTDSLQKMANYFDYSFLVNKLKYLFVMRNRQRILHEAYDFRMEAEILAYLDKHPHPHIPLIHLYNQLLILLQDIDNESLLKKIKAFFIQHETTINPEESRQIITAFTNICSLNLLLARSTYAKHRFDLGRILAEKDHLIVGSYIPHQYFRNTLRIAIEASELEWARWFIDAYLERVKPDQQENLSIFYRALLHFEEEKYAEQGDYMQSMGASNFKFINLFYEIDFRILAIKTDFALLKPKPKRMAKEAFQSKLDSFRNFLNRREGIPNDYKASCQNFRKAVSMLFHKRIGKRVKAQDLSAGLRSMTPITQWVWLEAMLVKTLDYQRDD